MNKRQKEVAGQFLEDERAVLKTLEKNYAQALADIKGNIKKLQGDPMTQSKIYQLNYQTQLERQLSAILDALQNKNLSSVSDYLNACYTNGFIGNVYDMQGQGVPLVLPIDQEKVLRSVQKTGDDFKLSNKKGISTAELKKQVQAELSRGLTTQLPYKAIARNISAYGQASYNRAALIARTEGHRVQNEAKVDSIRAAKEKGADIVKQWDATFDGSTRPTHQALDGQIRELDEAFSVGGKTAQYPGGFGDPAEDCNCRCAILQRARWAVMEESTYEKWNNEDGGYIECSGYAEFKEKYLTKANERATIKSLGNNNNFEIGRSLGAQALNYDVVDPETDRVYRFVEGTKIQDAEVFAGAGTRVPLHEGVAEGLTSAFGGSPENWKHLKGIGLIDYQGEELKAEVHWFQEETVGKVKFKVKRWLYDS